MSELDRKIAGCVNNGLDDLTVSAVCDQAVYDVGVTNAVREESEELHDGEVRVRRERNDFRRRRRTKSIAIESIALLGLRWGLSWSRRLTKMRSEEHITLCG